MPCACYFPLFPSIDPFLFTLRIEQFEAKLLKISENDEKKKLIENFKKKEIEFLNLKRIKMSIEDFQVIKLIGKGAFGIVRIFRFISLC